MFNTILSLGSILLKIIPIAQQIYPLLITVIEVVKEEKKNRGGASVTKLTNVKDRLNASNFSNKLTDKELSEIVNAVV